MSRLILLTPITAASALFGSCLSKNSAALLRAGIEPGPLYPTTSPPPEFFQNTQYWQENQAGADYAALRAILDAGHAALLTGSVLRRDLYNTFLTRAEITALRAAYPTTAIFLLGRPHSILECLLRYNYHNLDEAYLELSLEHIRQLPALLDDAARILGPENVHLLPDMADVHASHAAALLKSVFRLLDVDATPIEPSYGRWNFCFSTPTALRVLEALAVRGNFWPRMEAESAATLLEELGRLDVSWQPEYASPPSFRRAARSVLEAAATELERRIGLAPGSLSAPEEYFTRAGLLPDTPLDPARLEAFVERCPETARRVLHARFSNDRRFLNTDQEALLALLSATPSSVTAMSANGTPTQEAAEFSTLDDAAEEEPLLTVLTMTRNHEKYIAECMESVLAQKTNFSVRHLVLDHYSTDTTPDIINAYAAGHPSIRPLLLGGAPRRSNVRELLGRCRSRYVALCDGDDYFLSDHKLQRQVEFLENNPRCALVFHPVLMTFEDGSPPAAFPPLQQLPRGKIRKEYHLADLMHGNFIQTNSVVYRWRFREGLPDWFETDLCPGDWYWHMLHAETGRIGFIPEIMAVYRRHPNALYVDSFKAPVKHRRRHGKAELEAYAAYNRHFHGRYFRPLAKLASMVFTCFFEIAVKEGDPTLLDWGLREYPDFGSFFLQELKQEKARQAARPPQTDDAHAIRGKNQMPPA